jgi:hypothetical protein
VRATPKLDVLDRRATTPRVRHDMVELEEARLATPVAVAGHERTSTGIARGHCAAHRRGYRP